PVTTVTMIANYTQQNFANFVLLLPLIAINLAVFNLLPIPALDGAHMLFVFIEWIRKKPINRQLENKIHTIGLYVLFGFVILVDIIHFLG
ncbi:MAG: site-2 protease family protein, partial [Clostridia bacterium]|nr:site-2 protease family protein [Clostridia bacterium]